LALETFENNILVDLHNTVLFKVYYSRHTPLTCLGLASSVRDRCRLLSAGWLSRPFTRSYM